MNMDVAAILMFAIPAALFPVICLWSRGAGLAVFAALLPTYLLRTSINLPGAGLPELPTTLLEILFLELFIIWLLTDGLKKGGWRAFGPWAMPLALILTGATAGLLVSPDPRSAAGLWRAYFLEPILFFAVFVDIVKGPRQRLGVLAGLGSSLLLIGIIAVIQKITGFGIPNPVWQAEATRRVTAFFGFPNAIGLFAAPVIVLMAGLALAMFRSRSAQARWLSLLPALAALLGGAAAIFAVSEGGLIAAAAGLIALSLLDRRLRPAALILIIAGCLVVSLYRPVLNYASGVASLRDDSGSVRLIIWQETASMLADHPVFGAGLAGYRQVIAPYHAAKHIEIFMYPHNLVLNFWSEIGLIGLAGFIWLFVAFFREAFRLVRARPGNWLPRALIAAMAAVLVHGLVDVPYLKNDLAFLFWILMGLAETLRTDPVPTALPENKAKGWLPQSAKASVDEKAGT